MNHISSLFSFRPVGGMSDLALLLNNQEGFRVSDLSDRPGQRRESVRPLLKREGSRLFETGSFPVKPREEVDRLDGKPL